MAWSIPNFLRTFWKYPFYDKDNILALLSLKISIPKFLLVGPRYFISNSFFNASLFCITFSFSLQAINIYHLHITENKWKLPCQASWSRHKYHSHSLWNCFSTWTCWIIYTIVGETILAHRVTFSTNTLGLPSLS